MHLSMLSPRGGDPRHMWGIRPLLPSPLSGIWLRIWVPGWGRLLFCARRNVQTQHLQKTTMTKMMSKWVNALPVIPVLSGTILPVWRWKKFQSGLLPPANNLYRIDGHRALSCTAQHVRLFLNVRLRQWYLIESFKMLDLSSVTCSFLSCWLRKFNNIWMYHLKCYILIAEHNAFFFFFVLCYIEKLISDWSV